MARGLSARSAAKKKTHHACGGDFYLAQRSYAGLSRFLCKSTPYLAVTLHNSTNGVVQGVQGECKVTPYLAQKAHLYRAKPLCKVRIRGEQL
jgi:hypothetical protein